MFVRIFFVVLGVLGGEFLSTMRAMRRKISTALLLLSPLCALAQAPASPAEQQRAVMVEYFTAWRDSSIAAIKARSHRQTSLHADESGEQTRSEIEVECGGGYHLRVFHNDKLTTELYRIAGNEYRRDNGKWVSSPAANATYPCPAEKEIEEKVQQTRRIYELNLNNLDSVAAREQITKGPIKEIHGIRCQEWTVRPIPAVSAPDPQSAQLPHRPGEFSSVCISLEDHTEMERIMNSGNPSRPDVTTYYDWNKPLAIRAPQ